MAPAPEKARPLLTVLGNLAIALAVSQRCFLKRERILLGVIFEGKRDTFADYWEVLQGKPLVDQSVPQKAIQEIINNFI